MASFTTIDLNDFLPGHPATSAQGIALYENPLAIAEGASGAPKVTGFALNLFLGAITGTTAITGLDRAKILKIDFVAPDPVARVRFSSNGGSTWGAYQDIGPSITPGLLSIASVRLDIETGGVRSTYVVIGAATPNHGVITTPLTPVSGCNAIEISGISSADVWCIGGISP